MCTVRQVFHAGHNKRCKGLEIKILPLFYVSGSSMNKTQFDRVDGIIKENSNSSFEKKLPTSNFFQKFPAEVPTLQNLRVLSKDIHTMYFSLIHSKPMSFGKNSIVL